MKIKNKIRLLIREIITSQFEEERIPNPEADELVNSKENFIGSHTYGENIGNLNKMYVAYSYGEQHPLFVWVDKDVFKELRPNEVEDIEESKKDKKRLSHIYNNEVEHKDVGDEEVDLSYKEGPWFYNERPYYVMVKKKGKSTGHLKPNKWTYKHLEDLKPNEKTQARDTIYLKKLINDFKRKYKIGLNTHSDLEPGEK